MSPPGVAHLLDSAESVFRLVVDEAKEYAIFLIDESGRIESWNPGAEIIFGRPAAETVGQNFSILFTDADRMAGAPERELSTAREKGRAEDTRWHVRRDGRAFFADGVTTTIRDEAGKPIGFAKIARDITERYRTQQRLAAQLALTKLLNQDQPVAETARRVMQTVCENLRWQMGALWQINEAAGRMECVDEWHDPAIPDAVATELTKGITFAPGEGLPGEVWETGEAVWVTDLHSPRYPRASRAIRAGIQAAFAFPILHQGRVQGAMEFFSREAREPDQALLPAMTLIGSQIGEYMERRKTAVALRESEERYRVVAETASDAIFTIDKDSRILFCNPAVERVFGYKPEEIVGKNLQVIIPERFRAAHGAGIARYLQTHQRHITWNGVELPGLHRNGQEFPLEITFGEWTDGSRTIFTGFARDISERQRAAEELKRLLQQEQEARTEAESARGQLERRADEEAAFRHLASALTGAVEMTDVLHEITNRATQVTRADGVYVEKIIGPNKQVEIIASAGRGAPARGLRVAFPGSMTEEILKGREPVILTDMKTFGKSMAPYLTDTCPSCEVLVTPLIAEDEPLGSLVLLNGKQSGRVFRDSDVVRARTLGDLTSLALRRVRLMEQEREAKEKAEAAVRVRDETLGIVSHDLRNPLTKIALSADLLVQSPVEEHAPLVETIRAAAGQMQRLIQDLLDVARLETGRFSVDMKITAAEPIVRHACESNRPIAEQRRQSIVCNIEGDLGNICADRDRIVQVFSNLIGNAMKFTPEGGTITIEARLEGKFVEFRVRDNGFGIPEADVKNLFRAYWQAKKTAHMGAGLGLAIVRGIVEAHGGRVWAQNAPGGGAEFTFTIPQA